MKRATQGYYITTSTAGETVRAFVPAPLPPDPPIEWSPRLLRVFEEAGLALGRLGGLGDFLPETQHFLYAYVRKEAVLSSMIEGTQASLSDLLTYELGGRPGVPISDVQEVSRYVAALEHGLSRLAEGFPLSLRLIREVHAILLAEGRGAAQSPGEFRRSQNWIGGTRPGNAMYVPPPPERLMECLGAMEKFLHRRDVSPLIMAGLAHVQFETIHPFLDGNGRVGRLLITLLLCEKQVISRPLLYPSLYFKTHRSKYYQLLNRVRTDGDWEGWLEFFAEAIRETSLRAEQASRAIHSLFERDGARISTLGRSAKSVRIVHEAMIRRPISTPSSLAEPTGLTPATIGKSLESLLRLGIIEEISGRKRDRMFCYTECFGILNEE